MRVAGVDLSLRSTGLVVASVEGEGFHLEEAAALCPPRDAHPMERLWWIVVAVGDRLAAGPIDIAIEGYSFGARGAHVRSTAELGGLVRATLWRAGLRWWEVPPSTLKKYVTGRGNAKKDEMRLAAFKRWGFEHPSHDVVDAYGLARMLAGHHTEHPRKSDGEAWTKVTRVGAHPAD